MSSQPPRILIVDDEPQIARVLRTGLKTHGYEVRVAADGVSALETFGDWHPDLVVTDLAMPNMDGLDLCRRLRAISQLPIIVLSVRGEEKTKVEALDAGADDYVTKPFGMDELLARVRAQLRRATTPATTETSSAVLEVGDFRIDADARRVFVREMEVHLTPKEYELLLHFVRHAGKVLTHRTLLSAVWGGDYTEQGEYLRVFVGQLRKKIEPNPSTPRYILTEPWIGYRFNPDS
ncbi:MAG: response regulator transcription factor [Pyrinomonadaceae bacterium]|nr:response regulator transcription factor [Pyrinomonadaceae bacterium]MBA3572066.1 response regulator transcription factor [Pyrinomonadaceae bacterium]MDQ3173026.1 response regulator transcription factor [Acidobacteriota bacterium]